MLNAADNDLPWSHKNDGRLDEQDVVEDSPILDRSQNPWLNAPSDSHADGQAQITDDGSFVPRNVLQCCKVKWMIQIFSGI